MAFIESGVRIVPIKRCIVSVKLKRPHHIWIFERLCQHPIDGTVRIAVEV